MGKYDWLLEHKETYAYNYEYYGKGIIGYPIVIEGAVMERKKVAGISISWSYEDRGKIFKYTGVIKIRERNLFCHTRRLDDLEFTLAIFPLPSNYVLDVLWGISVGTSGGYPAAFRMLWTSQNLSISQVEKEFEKAGATDKNSLIAMDYDPDKFTPALAEEKNNIEDITRILLNRSPKAKDLLNRMKQKEPYE